MLLSLVQKRTSILAIAFVLTLYFCVVAPALAASSKPSADFERKVNELLSIWAAAGQAGPVMSNIKPELLQSDVVNAAYDRAKELETKAQEQAIRAAGLQQSSCNGGQYAAGPSAGSDCKPVDLLNAIGTRAAQLQQSGQNQGAPCVPQAGAKSAFPSCADSGQSSTAGDGNISAPSTKPLGNLIGTQPTNQDQRSASAADLSKLLESLKGAINDRVQQLEVTPTGSGHAAGPQSGQSAVVNFGTDKAPAAMTSNAATSDNVAAIKALLIEVLKRIGELTSK